MELKIVEDKKNRFVFKIIGEGHTLCNALKQELLNDDHVKVATYAVEHPLINEAVFVLETDGADTRKTISAAIKRLDKTLEKLGKQAKELK
ncbi:DNA-directed RNA polymerase subunit L [Candidatus Woesearchaeota archaeon]|nr:DNA-directed RNA polymerase subunit L [Candidatus Woesearchaeota archaeon]